MARRVTKGLVFVSYAHADRMRVEPLVRFLAARFNVCGTPASSSARRGGRL